MYTVFYTQKNNPYSYNLVQVFETLKEEITFTEGAVAKDYTGINCYYISKVGF